MHAAKRKVTDSNIVRFTWSVSNQNKLPAPSPNAATAAHLTRRGFVHPPTLKFLFHVRRNLCWRKWRACEFERTPAALFVSNFVARLHLCLRCTVLEHEKIKSTLLTVILCHSTFGALKDRIDTNTLVFDLLQLFITIRLLLVIIISNNNIININININNKWPLYWYNLYVPIYRYWLVSTTTNCTRSSGSTPLVDTPVPMYKCT